MRIALAQMNAGIDPVANIRWLEGAVEQAAAGDANMLFTPEMSGLLDRKKDRASKHLRSESDDLVLTAMCDAAAKHGIWIALGSLAVQMPGSQYLANRSFLIDDSGSIRARYDKMHLFDVDLPSGESWRESSSYAPGDVAVLADAPLGKLGLTICYDLRFPALFAALSDAGASVIAVPAAFTMPTGKAHWHVLLRARAIENACWIIAASQTGNHEDGRDTFGHSLVINPWGEIILDMGAEPGVAFAEIDQDAVVNARQRIPVLAHRRAVPHILT
jgi:deaminated glutathione amidase